MQKRIVTYLPVLLALVFVLSPSGTASKLARSASSSLAAKCDGILAVDLPTGNVASLSCRPNPCSAGCITLTPVQLPSGSYYTNCACSQSPDPDHNCCHIRLVFDDYPNWTSLSWEPSGTCASPCGAGGVCGTTLTAVAISDHYSYWALLCPN